MVKISSIRQLPAKKNPVHKIPSLQASTQSMAASAWKTKMPRIQLRWNITARFRSY